ncbi:PLP-dependent aminotransferase family protein [Pseudopedobacter sp.]|uniref:MocR-like pyridoxine biosynthesis transcription factor PdxR n=1 Tax=Pseudopedobacter sp. TaxID=1936787 RepID=UPI0033426C62
MLPYQTLINIETSSKRAIYEQIAMSLMNLINSGTIPAGTKLPSTRMLGEQLKIHRKTVIAAYEELEIQGWIISKNKSGYYVNSNISIPTISSGSELGTKYPAQSPIAIKGNYSQSFNERNLSNVLFLDDGLPDPRIAPYKILLREFKSLTDRDYNLKRANYGTSFNSSQLKRVLSAHLSKSRGINLSSENVFITNGAQMGIYLIAKALINPGDTFIIGKPGYNLAEQALKENGARTIGVSVDEKGIDVDNIEELCKKEIVKGVYVIPHHHFPTTVTLSPDRRIKLLSLARKYNFVIMEDDYDYEFHYTSAPYLPMASYNHYGHVIYVGSLSKCFSPALRLGFIVGPNDLVNAVAQIRKTIDIRGDLLLENSFAALLENGEIERHIRKSNKLYKERRDYMCEQIDLHLKDVVTYQVPAGGMAIWMRFLKEYNVEKIRLLVERHEISLSHNIIFSQYEEMNHIRLGFASLNFQEISICINAIKKSILEYDAY